MTTAAVAAVTVAMQKEVGDRSGSSHGLRLRWLGAAVMTAAMAVRTAAAETAVVAEAHTWV